MEQDTNFKNEMMNPSSEGKRQWALGSEVNKVWYLWTRC